MRLKAKFHKNPKAFKDNFTTQSKAYAAYRPLYPETLFRYLAGECREHKLAWDAGTGNGQSAQKLALYFDQVYATDASSTQILNAFLWKTSVMLWPTNRLLHSSDVVLI